MTATASAYNDAHLYAHLSRTKESMVSNSISKAAIGVISRLENLGTAIFGGVISLCRYAIKKNTQISVYKSQSMSRYVNI